MYFLRVIYAPDTVLGAGNKNVLKAQFSAMWTFTILFFFHYPTSVFLSCIWWITEFASLSRRWGCKTLMLLESATGRSQICDLTSVNLRSPHWTLILKSGSQKSRDFAQSILMRATKVRKIHSNPFRGKTVYPTFPASHVRLGNNISTSFPATKMERYMARGEKCWYFALKMWIATWINFF